MADEPNTKRVISFIDGQNLFHAAQEAFGYSFPNYNVQALSRAVCERQGWKLEQARFYTGIPSQRDDPFWNRWWSRKFATMGRQGTKVFWRHLRYRDIKVALPGGGTSIVRAPVEKGIDVRIALDIVRLAMQGKYDVALVFSQDQDLAEVADELRLVGTEHKQWLGMASAFPVGPATVNARGIEGTEWIEVEQDLYYSCRDPRDYR